MQRGTFNNSTLSGEAYTNNDITSADLQIAIDYNMFSNRRSDNEDYD